MKFDFIDIIALHEGKYPLMELQDYVKLAYQNEFGPMHLAEKDRLHQGIRSEIDQLSGQEGGNMNGGYTAERIGNGLSRLPLCGLPHPETDGQLIADLMIRTMKQHRGDMGDFEKKLQALEERLGPEVKKWLDDYRADGCPPVSHSETYRQAYQPHYRVIKTEYANWFPVLSEIAALIGGEKPVVISIDGRCGSGKSSLAEVVSEVFGGNVFHMDDFYLPPKLRADNWTEIPAGNMDLERFRKEVMEPVKEGKDVLYRPFDCQTGRLAGPAMMQPAKLTVVEGSYSQHPMLADQYDLKVFLTHDADVQRIRLSAREGEGVHSFFTHWIPMEERYHAAFGIEEKCDMVVDTREFWQMNEEEII